MTRLICVLCWLCRYSLLTIIAFGVGAADAAFGQEKPAEPAVKALNNAVLSKLPFNKQDDYQDAARGLDGTTTIRRTSIPLRRFRQPKST